MIFSTHFGSDRLDVSAVGEFRIGHDGGRIGVDEDDAVALLAQGLARLRAGIIELAGLADDDRAGADDQNGMNVGALRHKTKSPGLNAISPGLSWFNLREVPAACRRRVGRMPNFL